MAEERLQKILSRAGIASRRAAEQLILEGRVQVNGKVVRELGTKADPQVDLIRVDDQLIAEPEPHVYLVLYKPERMVTTLSDPEGRPSVGDVIRKAKLKVFPVGRLDYDAEGVLLLTNDGELAHKLTHPRWGCERTYHVKVKGEPTEATMERLRAGVRLEDGRAVPKEATFLRRTPKNSWIRLVLTEGRHHLVKRLCAAVGHPVARLVRVDYAGVGLEGMRPGDFRELEPREVQALRAAVAQQAPLPPGGLPRRRRRGGGAVANPVLGFGPRRGRPEGARFGGGDAKPRRGEGAPGQRPQRPGGSASQRAGAPARGRGGRRSRSPGARPGGAPGRGPRKA